MGVGSRRGSFGVGVGGVVGWLVGAEVLVTQMHRFTLLWGFFRRRSFGLPWVVICR